MFMQKLIHIKSNQIKRLFKYRKHQYKALFPPMIEDTQKKKLQYSKQKRNNITYIV